MPILLLGFFTGLSLIFAIGAQNIFVIEQGLKKQSIFLVCLVCAISDLILIFFGIFLFHYFINYFNYIFELILNILLVIFLLYFIYVKTYEIINFKSLRFNNKIKKYNSFKIFLKTLGFTYLNPHVYSDTVFFLGNFSKSFTLENKIYFGVGASTASFLFFFSLGYLSSLFANRLNNNKSWKYINTLIVIFMLAIIFYIIKEIIYSIAW